MAGLRWVAQTTKIPTGTSRKTLLQILAPANQRLKIDEIDVSFEGVNNVAVPILVEIFRQTNAGDGGDVITAKKMDPGYDEAIQTTVLEDLDGSFQPGDGDEVQGEMVHAQGGYTWQAGFGKEIIVPGGGRLGLIVTAGAGVNAKARFYGEE